MRYPNFIKIDLLSIDVEGHEKEVLEGLKNNQFNTKIIILEIDKCNLSSISNLAALQNHTATYTNGINTFFLITISIFLTLIIYQMGFQHVKFPEKNILIHDVKIWL